jgi:hypothetical protein
MTVRHRDVPNAERPNLTGLLPGQCVLDRRLDDARTSADNRGHTAERGPSTSGEVHGLPLR